MTPERWSQIKDIFAAVTDLSAAQRKPALKEACHGDTELQAELEQLLAQHDEMGRFLDGSPPAAVAAMLSPGQLVAERYEVVVLLGSGGMGEVYEAEDKELGGRIALKVVHPQMSFSGTTMERFRREVQLARQVTHPNVCRVFDIGRHREKGLEFIFLTMELVRGETLSARLKRAGKLASPEANAIAVQLCRALDAAHRAGILHRDFKCANVMLVGSGEGVRAVVTDFGIARGMRASEETASALTSQGAIFGTPAYMSPEQIQGKELTVASDIYSLGLVLYEMVTGVRPFQDESPWSEAMRRLTEDPVAPAKIVPGLGEPWNRTILACLQRDPVRRLAPVAKALDSLRGEKRRVAIIHEHRWLAVPALALVLAMASAISYWYWWRLPSLPVSKHIAVLPFALAGKDPANQAMADELAQSLAVNLAHLQESNSSLWVVPWKNVQDRPRNDEKHAGAALGVNLLVTGEIEKQDGRMLLRTKIKDATTLRELRSRVMETSEDKIVSLEDTLLETVSTMLQVRVPEGTLRHLPVDETSEPGAYEFYAQGKGYLLRHDAESVDRAIALFEKALAKDPKFALAHADLAFAYAWKYGDTRNPAWLDQASQACAQAVSLDSRLSPAHLTLGMIQQATGNVENAIQEYQQALELDPANDEARNLLALALDKEGRVLEAEKLLKDGLKRNAANWVSYDFLGVFYYDHFDHKQAEPLFRVAAELAPDNPVAFYNLGGIYLTLGRNQEAETILRRAIAIKPTAGAYSNLGSALLNEHRYGDSAAMLQKAVELAPNDHRYWFNLGNAYTLAQDQGNSRKAYEGAVRAAEKSLALKPKDGELLEILALYNATLGEPIKAKLALAQVPAPFAGAPQTLFKTAQVYELIGQRDQALKALRDALHAGYPLSQIENTAFFAGLRADPRYRKMIDSQGPVRQAAKR